MTNLDDQGVVRLCEAVIVRAAWDYRIALVREHKAKTKETKMRYSDEVRILKKFFEGEEIKFYTKVDGSKLAEMIEKEVAEYNYDLKEIRKSCNMAS